MTLTPDRNSEKPEERAGRASAARTNASGADRSRNDFRSAGDGTASVGSGRDDGESADDERLAEVISLRDQLAAAGFDLSGHPLADEFGARDAVDMSEPPPADEPASDYFDSIDDPDISTPPFAVDQAPHSPSSELRDPEFEGSERQGAEFHGTGPESCEGSEGRDAAGDDAAPAWVSRHPLLTDAGWADLSAFAPEITGSITTLMDFSNGLRSFEKPMGPDEALLLVDGVEALSRITEALSTLALSVYERVGTPTDSGAKSTKALIQHRLNLTPTEANRRTELAKNLGGRVSESGQRLAPLCPEVADGLHNGSLSAGQAKAIDDCMSDLPDWVSPEKRAEVEKQLVDYAPQVRVRDLRGIFDHMLGYLDPDGKRPREETPRADYSVTIRPKANGDWVLGGLLDPVSGAALNGLLTSRIQSADQAVSPPSTAGSADAGQSTGSIGSDSPGATEHDGQESLFDVVDAVLRGDRYDAPLPIVDDGAASAASGGVDRAVGIGNGGAEGPADSPVGVGVREDGTSVDLTDERPTARALIYERFATLVSRISMEQAGTGSPYALVVTATADDLANGTGEGTTGVETPIPIDELRANGLNGAVFFHLMSEKATTVQVATEKRFADKKQVAIITARDKGCTFPGCDAPPGWCEANHVVPWARGGRTDINNLALVCSYHHHQLDRSDWEMRMLADGRPSWIPPAAVDPARRPILHPRYITAEIIASLFGEWRTGPNQ
ncbi:hypothetical protein KACC15558_17910 [Brevibacterium ammoniilyticum]|uniref:HNH nuclease domain-containing protein n=1 Tax=Brevibacterium ammoniilyticum TaxID=1046555 RepID=A0ABP9U1D2_9MICO